MTPIADAWRMQIAMLPIRRQEPQHEAGKRNPYVGGRNTALCEKNRRLVFDSIKYELSIKAIAELTGLSITTVKVQLNSMLEIQMVSVRKLYGSNHWKQVPH